MGKRRNDWEGLDMDFDRTWRRTGKAMAVAVVLGIILTVAFWGGVIWLVVELLDILRDATD